MIGLHVFEFDQPLLALLDRGRSQRVSFSEIMLGQKKQGAVLSMPSPLKAVKPRLEF